MKIKFIDKKTHLHPSLSKLFNIVVNYNQLNSPDKVGYCTSIYSDFFRDNPTGSFEEAVQYYYKCITDLGNGLGMLIINTHMDKTFSYSLKLIQELDEVFNPNDKTKYTHLLNYLDNLGNSEMSRKDQYKSMVYKTLSIFYKENYDSVTILNNVKNWYLKIKEFDEKTLKETAKKYLFDLLTINSMIGTLIQNDILKYLSTKFEVYGTNNSFEKLDIDGFINGKRASIKSVNYKNSAYKRVASRDIEESIGSPIIYYKIVGDTYSIVNLDEILDFYSVYGTDDKVLKEIEKVKDKKII